MAQRPWLTLARQANPSLYLHLQNMAEANNESISSTLTHAMELVLLEQQQYREAYLKEVYQKIEKAIAKAIQDVRKLTPELKDVSDEQIRKDVVDTDGWQHLYEF